MVASAFRRLAGGLTRSRIGAACLVSLDGQPVPARGLLGEEQVQFQMEDGRVVVVTQPTISLCLADLPSKPKVGDRITIGGKIYRIDLEPELGGAGMIDCNSLTIVGYV